MDDEWQPVETTHRMGAERRVPTGIDVDAVDPVPGCGEALRVSLAAWLLAAARGAADLLFPPVCRGCARFVQRHAAVCPACWGSLRLIERPFCEVLGVPFSHDLGRGILSADA
ncbi:MAG: double zinc ribbon domain-containing protein, partial [Pararhizobium sp.]